MSNALQMLREIRSTSHGITPLTTTPPRKEITGEYIDSDKVVEITADPYLREETAFVDGTQISAVLTHHNSRPIVLAHVAAGAMQGNIIPVDGSPVERMFITCHEDDKSNYDHTELPVLTVDETNNPMELPETLTTLINTQREETEILAATYAAETHTTIVDGSIAMHNPCITGGVVKTTNTKYLSDETPIITLPEGHRTGIFTYTKNNTTIHSAYLRLRHSEKDAWNHGLIRVEAWAPETIDQICATAINLQQHAGTDDKRGDRHLMPVASVETWLRARRPTELFL